MDIMLSMWFLSSPAHLMVVPPFHHVWHHQRSRDHHYDAQFIYRIKKIFITQNNAFFTATVQVVKDAADATDWDTGITMGTLFAFLLMSPSVQVHVVARQTNGIR